MKIIKGETMFHPILRRCTALASAVVLSLATGLITAGCSNSSQHKDAKPVVLKSVNHIGGYGINKTALFPTDKLVSKEAYEKFVQETVWKQAEKDSSQQAHARTLGSLVTQKHAPSLTSTTKIAKASSSQNYYYVFFACKSDDPKIYQADFTITLNKGDERRAVDMKSIGGIPCDGNLSVSAIPVKKFLGVDSLTVSAKNAEPRISLLIQESDILI